jgi:uncharacterized flavoprotein (TIGR03862 family)
MNRSSGPLPAKKKKVVIVGGGACSLMLACQLDETRAEVHIYERNAAPGRKFLVAGDGGFNLTHSEDPSVFLTRYTPCTFLRDAFLKFSNHDLIQWLESNGIPTFTGTSGRIFPEKGIKPVEVLNVFLNILRSKNVQIHTKHEWKGFNDTLLLFSNNEQNLVVGADHTVFCLGGGSWPVTGSKGDWVEHFRRKSIGINPFSASNCAFHTEWSSEIKAHAGKALKNIRIRCGDVTRDGEVVLTARGIEGSGIYFFSPQIREQLNSVGHADIYLDLKPSLSVDQLKEKIKKCDGVTGFSEKIKTLLGFGPAQMTLLKSGTTRHEFFDADHLSKTIKNLPVKIIGTDPVEDAISTAGGIHLDELDESFMLRKLPGFYAIGEMLDYDAPTGGYLLQSCFSMATYVAATINQHL